jgi:hypothetical protein
VYSIGLALPLAIGVVSAVRPHIHDDDALHEAVSSRFASEPWFPHLVAASPVHGADTYYFDPRDEVVLLAACRSLVPFDTAMKMGTSLHQYTARRDTFIRLCPS